MSKNTVIFYAPVGNLTKGFKSGGAEAGCKKTIEVLEKGGLEILLVEKPSRKSGSKLHGILLLLALFKIWLRAIKAFRKNKDGVFHVAGFYLNQIYFEWLLLATARFFKVKTIYEIRNGGMIEAYQAGGKVYKYFMKSVLVKSTLVLCQGYDYVVFLKNEFNKDSVYYPNYIMDSFITDNNTGREHAQKIKLIYFGRVVPDKNVGFIIDVCRELKVLNIEFTLDIIGSYEEEYHKGLMRIIDEYSLQENIVFYGRLDFKDIYSHLKQSHFFVFPSKEKREGHSNSLTEAMGCGVVPLVSTAGFNESIAGNPVLVVREFNPALYASKIALIWNTGQWKPLSDSVYNRVVKNYTETVVKQYLLDAYAKLFALNKN